MRLRPRVPSEERDLGRAVELLGRWSSKKFPLTETTLNELRDLIEVLPSTKSEARQWKISLRNSCARKSRANRIRRNA